ncbi:MAG TPA: hypothetical protein VGB14_12975 [Acidimicrobiales bacterium]
MTPTIPAAPAPRPPATSAVEHAVLALAAVERGDGAAARHHAGRARREARPATRRDRQRGAGLALEHAAEFPGDADLLAHVAG